MATLSERILLGRKYLTKVLTEAQQESLYRLSLGKEAFFFIEGLASRQERSEQESFAESLALGVLGFMNLRPVSYRNEYDGALIHDIMPRPGKEDQPSSSGRVSLPFHSDMAFLRFAGETKHTFKAAAPDFLILAGVANEGAVPTKLITVTEILENLSDEDIQILSEPLFDIRSPATVTPPKNAEAVPLLVEHFSYARQLRFNGGLDKIIPRHGAHGALSNLVQSIARPEIGYEADVQPGTILVFNNRKVVHGRGAIKPRIEGSSGQVNRHFKRVYGQFIETDCCPLFSNNPFMQVLGG